MPDESGKTYTLAEMVETLKQAARPRAGETPRSDAERFTFVPVTHPDQLAAITEALRGPGARPALEADQISKKCAELLESMYPDKWHDGPWYFISDQGVRFVFNTLPVPPAERSPLMLRMNRGELGTVEQTLWRDTPAGRAARSQHHQGKQLARLIHQRAREYNDPDRPARRQRLVLFKATKHGRPTSARKQYAQYIRLFYRNWPRARRLAVQTMLDQLNNGDHGGDVTL